MEEVIEEPSLDASLCSFHSPNSEVIQYYYKLKYPNAYTLPRGKIMDLLENKEVFSGLEQSVSSFIRRVRRADDEPKIERILLPNEYDTTEPISIIVEDSDDATVMLDLRGSDSGDSSPLPDLVSPLAMSTDFSTYDSVHSINVPTVCCMEGTDASEVQFDDSSSCSDEVEVPASDEFLFKRFKKPRGLELQMMSEVLENGRKSTAPFGGI